MCLLTGNYNHVQTQKWVSLALMCSARITCSRKGQSCWWSCYGRLGPCRVRTQGFECRHPAPCWLEAGFSGRAPVCTQKKKKRNVCQSAKFTKWADWVCRKGSLTEDDINHLLWNCSKYRDESGCIFQPKKKDRTNYTGFAFKARTQNSEWGVGKEKNPTNLTYKFHLVSCITLLC